MGQQRGGQASKLDPFPSVAGCCAGLESCSCNNIGELWARCDRWSFKEKYTGGCSRAVIRTDHPRLFHHAQLQHLFVRFELDMVMYRPVSAVVRLCEWYWTLASRLLVYVVLQNGSYELADQLSTMDVSCAWGMVPFMSLATATSTHVSPVCVEGLGS